MPDTGSDTRSGIGARLRAGREKMGLTQLQAAEKLHVDLKVVESLEAEDFEALGAPVFVRGHLKRYAELTGEKTAELLDLYAAASTQPALPDLTKLPKAAPDSNPSRLAVPALVVLIAFVLLGLVWWVVKTVSSPAAVGARRGPQPVAIAPEASRDPAVSDVSEGEGAPSTNEAAARAPGESGVSRAPASAEVSTAGTRAPTSSPALAPAGAVPPGTAASAAAGDADTSGGKPMQVTLRFAADSWVEVYDANGEKLFYDVGTAASARTVSGTPPFRVNLGNAPGVTLDVNGKPAAIPADAMKGELARFVINRSGRIVRARSQADGG